MQGKSMPERARTTSAEGYVLQIKKIGNSTGVILPKELLARLKLAEGDRLYVVEQTERGMKLSPYDPKHAKAMELARRSFRRYADTYKALAK
jgi:putative addiction module antidote